MAGPHQTFLHVTRGKCPIHLPVIQGKQTDSTHMTQKIILIFFPPLLFPQIRLVCIGLSSYWQENILLGGLFYLLEENGLIRFFSN